MEENNGGQNRRKFERLDTAFTLTYRVERPLDLSLRLGFSQDIDALMLNLSDSGLAMVTRHDLPVGAQLLLKLNIIDLRLEGDERYQRMEIGGEVVSNVSLPDSGHKIGIQFKRVTEAEKLLISDYIKRNKL